MNLDIAEAYVRERFDVDLPVFVREKAEVEGLYDYEIADALNLDIPIVRRVRNIRGIKRRHCFAGRFNERYGKDSVDTFRRIIEKPDSSLADTARHFGFTREYARQVYRKINGHPYTETHSIKLAARRRLREELKERDLVRPKRDEWPSVIKVKKMARLHGYAIGLPKTCRGRRYPNNITVNNHKVCVKSSFGTTQMGRNVYFGFSRTSLGLEDCDFFICVCHGKGKDTYYVIPYDVLPKKGFTIPAGERHKGPWRNQTSKYSRYMEAWDLLGGSRPGLTFERKGAVLQLRKPVPDRKERREDGT